MMHAILYLMKNSILFVTISFTQWTNISPGRRSIVWGKISYWDGLVKTESELG